VEAAIVALRAEMRRRSIGAEEMFARCDWDGDDRLSRKEFCDGVARAGLRPLPSRSMLGRVFDAIDADGNRRVTLGEIVAVLGAEIEVLHGGVEDVERRDFQRRGRDRRDMRASARRGTFFGTYSPEEAARVRRAGQELPAASPLDLAVLAEVDAAEAVDALETVDAPATPPPPSAVKAPRAPASRAVPFPDLGATPEGAVRPEGDRRSGRRSRRKKDETGPAARSRRRRKR
jgi:hypothetical protein